MRNFPRSRTLACLAALACGLLILTQAKADPIADAGLTQDFVQQNLAEAAASGNFSPPPGLNKLGADARVALVKTVGTLAMSYTKTDDFKQRYAAWRAENEPKPPTPISASDMASRNAQAQADFAKQQSDLNNAAANIEAQRAQLKKAGLTDAQIDDMEKQISGTVSDLKSKGAMPTQAPQMTDAQRQQENQNAEQSYETQKAQFDRDHPADPNQAIKQDLQKFLDLSASVDFAATTDKGQFTDPADAQKPAEWKLCYRAGKPAVDAARAIAEEWLKGL